MTTEEKRVFFTDVSYVHVQAAAFRSYLTTHRATLATHPFGQIIHNALLESSLAFLRKSNEFFGSCSEASVRTFFPDYPLKWLWSKEDSELLNDRVMHLSTREAKSGKVDWTDFYGKHLPEAERRFTEFRIRIENERAELLQTNG